VSRRQTESFDSQMSRLQQMTDPQQQTWDLSPNDVAAIAAALDRIASLESAAANLVRLVERRRHDRDWFPVRDSAEYVELRDATNERP